MSIQTPEQVLQHLDAVRDRINVHQLWRAACLQWGEAVGGPGEYEYFADKLIAALSLPAAAVPTDEQLLSLAKQHGAFSAGDQRGLILWEHMGGQPGLIAFARAVLALASPAPAAAPEQQQQDIRDGSALSASAPRPERIHCWKCGARNIVGGTKE